MKGIRLVAPALAGLMLVTGLAIAPALSETDDAATVIHERQQQMKDFGAAMKAIGGYIQGGIGSHEDVATAAGVIAQGSAMLPDHFPPGTGMDEVMEPRTGARMVIWEQWDDFVAAAQANQDRALAVQAAATAMDDTALASAFEALGNDGCGGCHKTFRQKLD